MPGFDKGCPALLVGRTRIRARQPATGFIEAALAVATRLTYTAVTYLALRMMIIPYPLDISRTWQAGA